jgi:hypothetical protein
MLLHDLGIAPRPSMATWVRWFDSNGGAPTRRIVLKESTKILLLRSLITAAIIFIGTTAIYTVFPPLIETVTEAFSTPAPDQLTEFGLEVEE